MPLRKCIFVAASVFAISLLTYFLTLAPVVTFVDSGELISAAYTFGVAHPPGTPLYTLLGGVFASFPFGTVAERVGFMSAFFGALTPTATVVAIIASIWGENSDAAGVASDETLDWTPGMITSAFGGLVLAFSRTLWSYSAIAEVYTLNSFLVMAVIACILWWRMLTVHREKVSKAVSDRETEKFPLVLLVSAAFLFGSGLGVHHVTVAVMAPALLFIVLTTSGPRFFRSRSFWYAAAATLAGLCVYIYLPLAATRAPMINWGDPDTLGRFWRHISGWQYQAFISFSTKTVSSQFGEFLKIAASQYGSFGTPILLILAAAGVWHLWKVDRILFAFLSLVAACDLLLSLNYEIAEDKDAYYLPLFLTWAMVASFGFRYLLGLLDRLDFRSAYRSAAGALIGLVILEVVFVGNLKVSDKSEYFLADDYVNNIYRSAANGSMILTTDWQVYSPSLYKTVVERERPDLIVIDVNQMRRSWYFQYLDRAYPDLMKANRDRERAFLEDLQRWEADPSLYSTDPALTKRIETRFRDLIGGMVSYQRSKGNVYLTQEIAEVFAAVAADRSRDPSMYGRDGVWVSGLVGNFGLIPSGLVMKLTEPGTKSGDLPDVPLEMRGLREAAALYGRDDVVTRKVIPVYLKMALSRGYMAYSLGDVTRARREFDSALAVDPSFEPAKQALSQMKQVSFGK